MALLPLRAVAHEIVHGVVDLDPERHAGDQARGKRQRRHAGAEQSCVR